MEKINEIIGKYTMGEADLEATNAALAAAGSDLRLDPARHALTEAEIAETTAGGTATEANGWGLLDMGLGAPSKVEVRAGKLVHDDVGAMTAWCIIGGKSYQVSGNTLED